MSHTRVLKISPRWLLTFLTAAVLAAAAANAQTVSISVCGTVTAYVAPSVVPGLIVIGGQSIPIAVGTSINGEGLIAVGSDLCLNGTLNAAGQLVAPATVTANATTTVSICGMVSAYTAATASSPGSITIGGQTFPISAGTQIDGSGIMTLGANVCLNGTVNAGGQLVVPSSVTANATTAVSVCGVVSSYTAATVSGPGSIAIGGQTFSIAAGTQIDGSGLITAGANLCLNGTVNAAGQLVVPSSVTANATTAVSVCGTVSAYAAATASSPGSITVGSQTFSIAAGTQIDGSGLVRVGANLCLNGSVSASGQLVTPTTVTANATTSVKVCGTVTAYTAATGSSPGSITIGGQTFSIAAGTTFGPEVRVGASLCFDLPIASGGGGQISNPGSGPIPSAPANEIVFPVVAHLTGVGGSEWRTDVRVINLGASPATVTFEWYPFSPGGRPGPAQSAQVIVNPGVQGVFNQLLTSLFNTEGGGSVRLVSASFDIGAALRLYHDTAQGPCEGTFGTFEKGLKRSESTSRAALLVLGHRPADRRQVRTNLGYFNASSDSVQITFHVFATDGRLLGSKTMTLPSFANDQRSVIDMVETVASSDRDQQDFYVTFEAQGGMPFVYGSAVYNSTNDGLYVIPWQY